MAGIGVLEAAAGVLAAVGGALVVFGSARKGKIRKGPPRPVRADALRRPGRCRVEAFEGIERSGAIPVQSSGGRPFAGGLRGRLRVPRGGLGRVGAGASKLESGDALRGVGGLSGIRDAPRLGAGPAVEDDLGGGRRGVACLHPLRARIRGVLRGGLRRSQRHAPDPEAKPRALEADFRPKPEVAAVWEAAGALRSERPDLGLGLAASPLFALDAKLGSGWIHSQESLAALEAASKGPWSRRSDASGGGGCGGEAPSWDFPSVLAGGAGHGGDSGGDSGSFCGGGSCGGGCGGD